MVTLVRLAAAGGAAAIVGVGVAIGAVVYLRGPGPMDFSGGTKVALAEYKAADPTGVPTELSKANPVERGAYLARAADCMVCHTAPGGKEYTGGFPFKLPFGTLYSTNITPDKETGIGNYTDQQFLDAMHRGVRRDGSRLYPAMPYTSYTYVTDADALAIKAYLFSLPPVHAPAVANDLLFPFNQRWAMLFWATIFNPGTRFQADVTKDAQWNRGAYLAEALAHCGECHTPRNVAFGLDNRKKFGGALAAGWRAFNISSDKIGGIGAWHDQDVLSYLSIGRTSGHGTASGPMGEAVDHSFSTMTRDDVAAIAAFVRSVPGVASSTTPVSASAAPDSHKDGKTANPIGKRVFQEACASCHGWSGKSPVSEWANLTGSAAVNDPDAINVAQIVIGGTKRFATDDALSMPAFGHAYSDDEIAAVANYVTARFGAQGSSLNARDIAGLRKQVPD